MRTSGPRRVSYFHSLMDPSSPVTESVIDLLKGIRGGLYRSLVEPVRSASTKELRDALKKKLPLTCWSGTFSDRNNAGLLHHSGLICFDFDNIPEKDLASERQKPNRCPLY